MSREQIDSRIEHFRAALRRTGVRLTPQRECIFREVLSSSGHPDAEAVFERVKRRLPGLSLDTVYRNLWLLTELGLLSTLGPRQPRIRFDARTSPHHHYVCLKCGAARDFESPELEMLRGVATFGTVLSAHLEVRGVCASCSLAGADGELPRHLA